MVFSFRYVQLVLIIILQLPLYQATAQVFYRQESGTTADLHAVDFTDDSLGLTVGDAGTILRTTDGGSSWQPASSGVSSHLRCVKWMSTSSALVAGFDGKILRTTDEGITWSATSGPFGWPLIGCDALDSLRAVIVGLNGVILQSDDGGVSWALSLQQTGTNFHGVSYVDSLNILVSGTSGRITRSTDGGLSWSWSSLGLFYLNDVDFADADHGITVGSGGGVVLFTTDGGNAWIGRTAGSTHYDLEFGSPSLAVAVGTTAITSTNGGNNWTTRSLPVTLRGVKLFGPGDYLAVGNGGAILRTVTGAFQPPAPVLRNPPDRSDTNGLSPRWREEFSLSLAWEPYLSYYPDSVRMQVSTDSTFLDVTFLDIVFRAGGVIDTQRRIMHFVPGRKYFWRIRMLFENSESPWSDTWSFATSIEQNSRTIREIQEVSADSLILAEYLQNSQQERWTLQSSPLYPGAYFVTALCAASARDLYDPYYLQQGAAGGSFIYCVDTGASTGQWHGMKFVPEWDTNSESLEEIFSRIREGDVIVCAGRISEDPWDNMNSETSFYVSWVFKLDSLNGVTAPVPSSVSDFFSLAPGGQHVRYTTGEPLEGRTVELTNLTVYTHDNSSYGTFFVRSPGGLTMSTADYSRWFTLRSHRDTGSVFEPPHIGRHIDTLRGVIATTGGDYNSWTHPRYRLVPVRPGDIVYGDPTGNLLTGKIFYDSSRNGTQDPGEPGIEDWTFEVGGKVLMSTTTGPDGVFSVAGLDSGGYDLRGDLPSGWFVSTNDSLHLDFSLAFTDTVRLGPVGLYYGWNRITGVVFEDTNENGVLDAGEPGMGGIAVHLSGTLTEVTHTDSSGTYSFDFVTQGVYDIRVTLPPGWEQIAPSGDGMQHANFTDYNQVAAGQDFSFRHTPPRRKSVITVRDSREDASRDILFGVRSGASFGIWGVDTMSTNIDFSEGEFEIPPPLPGLFDVRFEDPVDGMSFGEGSWSDIRNFVSIAQADTYRITFRPGTLYGGDYPMRFFWSREAVLAGYIRDVILTDSSANPLANMKTSDSLIVTDPAINTLYLVARGPVLRISDIENDEEYQPDDFALYQNYPNPFNASTVIRYRIPVRSRVTINVFDILGRIISTLVAGVKHPGQHHAYWRAGDIPSGVYYYRITAGEFTDIKKMVAVK